MSIETVRELETLASVCPELNMANYTEDDVRHLNDWAIEMSLLVERYALSQQPATAIACGIPGMAKTTCPYCEQGFAFEHEQPATGEPFGYIHHFATHDERGALIDTTWEADGCADPLPHPTSPAMWKWSHCTPFYTTPQPAQATQATDYVGGEPDGIVIGFHEGNALVDHAGNLEEGNCLFLSPTTPTQATQATPSIPSDGPSTYAQRFTAAVAVICGVTPPAALVCDWINKEERHDDLQQWVGSYAPGWAQNIAVLDAAHQMADQPTEGGNHEPAQQPATPASVQADSSEHLRVVASLGDALRRLSFAAQTTGGTDGPDAELQSAIGQAEQALSLGGIWQAMSATTEPVKAAPYNTTEEMRCAMRRIDPALSSEQCRALWSAAWSAAPSTHPAPSAAVTPEPVEDGIRNAEDELNCAEEVLDAITCEFSDGEFPVTDFNCIGDYITAVVDVFKERLAAQQPATGEPVASRNPFASRCYAMSESHLSGHRLIVGFEKLGDAQDAHEWVARQGRGDFTHPATGEPVGYMNEGHIHELAMRRIPYGYVYPEAGAGASTAVYTHPAPSVLKDDQIAALVNKVRDIARMFNDHQSLRERIAIELVPVLKVTQEVKSDAERGRFLIEWLKRYGLLQAEFVQMGVGKKPENWWLLYAPWGIDQTRPFLAHGKTPEQAIDDAKEEPNV